jgi:hypothetical protein
MTAGHVVVYLAAIAVGVLAPIPVTIARNESASACAHLARSLDTRLLAATRSTFGVEPPADPRAAVAQLYDANRTLTQLALALGRDATTAPPKVRAAEERVRAAVVDVNRGLFDLIHAISRGEIAEVEAARSRIDEARLVFRQSVALAEQDCP